MIIEVSKTHPKKGFPYERQNFSKCCRHSRNRIGGNRHGKRAWPHADKTMTTRKAAPSFSNSSFPTSCFLPTHAKNLYEHSPEFKAQLEKVKEDMLVNFAMAKALESVKVPTDDEVKAYYEENKDKFVSGESVNASHILVDSEEKANALLGDITSGKISFEDAARQHSSCPSSENGGNLGEFTRGQMVPEFDQAVFSMNEGEVKGPVKTQFGYHLIKLNSKNAAKPFEFADIKEQIKQMMYKERQQKAYRARSIS